MPSILATYFTAIQQKTAGAIRREPHTLRISMLGPSGIGKTSMILAMCDQFDRLAANADLQLTVLEKGDLPTITEDLPTITSGISLFRAIFSDLTKLIVDVPKLPGTMKSEERWFGLGKIGRHPQITLHFVDYPGGWIEPSPSDADGVDRLQSVRRVLRDSEAIVIPIDAPALMEPFTTEIYKESREGKDNPAIGHWHHQVNKPTLIKNLVRDAFVDLETPRLVILAPIRCEVYLKGNDRRQLLVKRVQEGYSELLKTLDSELLREKVAVVIAPVQTLGGAKFYFTPKNEYRPVWRKFQLNSQYTPEDSDQPLRYLLRFLMQQYRSSSRPHSYAQLGWMQRFGLQLRDGIGRLFHNDENLIRATEEFAKGCKSTDGFAIIQGKEWLG